MEAPESLDVALLLCSTEDLATHSEVGNRCAASKIRGRVHLDRIRLLLPPLQLNFDHMEGQLMTRKPNTRRP